VHVVFLSWRDSSHPDGGGSEVYVESVARELAVRGHRVTLVCARHGGAPAVERRDGITIRRLGGRLTVYPRALAWLVRHRRRVDAVVDVVNGLPFASPLVRRRGIVALVHHLHEEQWRLIYPGWRGRLGWWVESRLTPRLYRDTPFVTVSDATRRDLAGIGVTPGRVVVAPNALDPAPAVHQPEAPGPRLCVLARLVPHKRIEHAFTVVARLQHELPDLQLDLIGDGWWRAELEADAARQGVTDRVHFHGHVPAERRDQLLARAWLMLMPSVKEGWCLAVTEAAAQGTPTIAYSDAGGVRESIADGVTGTLVSTLDQMVAESRRLLRDDDVRRRLGTQARVRSATHTWGSTTDVIEQTLRSRS
jgi:glycosyltransferase involved in cell wall biosynthesis